MDAWKWQQTNHKKELLVQGSTNSTIIPSQTLTPYPNPGDFSPSLQKDRNINMETRFNKAPSLQMQPYHNHIHVLGGSDERRLLHPIPAFLCLCGSFFPVFFLRIKPFFESVFLITESPINKRDETQRVHGNVFRISMTIQPLSRLHDNNSYMSYHLSLAIIFFFPELKWVK